MLIASAPPSATALCQPRPHGAAGSANGQASSALPASAPTIVSTTCARPRPNTSVRMLRSFGRLNSRPITNIRNTTPNSAR